MLHRIIDNWLVWCTQTGPFVSPTLHPLKYPPPSPPSSCIPSRTSFGNLIFVHVALIFSGRILARRKMGDDELQDGFASVRGSWPENFLVNFPRFPDSNGEILRWKNSLFMW